MGTRNINDRGAVSRKNVLAKRIYNSNIIIPRESCTPRRRLNPSYSSTTPDDSARIIAMAGARVFVYVHARLLNRRGDHRVTKCAKKII